MKTTIDKAGRVVIPASLRERAGLTPGAQIDITIGAGGDITISRPVPAPKLVKLGGITVVRAQTRNPPKVDVAKLIREERDRWPL